MHKYTCIYVSNYMYIWTKKHLKSTLLYKEEGHEIHPTGMYNSSYERSWVTEKLNVKRFSALLSFFFFALLRKTFWWNFDPRRYPKSKVKHFKKITTYFNKQCLKWKLITSVFIFWEKISKFWNFSQTNIIFAIIFFFSIFTSF